MLKEYITRIKAKAAEMAHNVRTTHVNAVQLAAYRKMETARQDAYKRYMGAREMCVTICEEEQRMANYTYTNAPRSTVVERAHAGAEYQQNMDRCWRRFKNATDNFWAALLKEEDAIMAAYCRESGLAEQ